MCHQQETKNKNKKKGKRKRKSHVPTPDVIRRVANISCRCRRLLRCASSLLLVSTSSASAYIRHVHHMAVPRLRQTSRLRPAPREKLLHQFGTSPVIAGRNRSHKFNKYIYNFAFLYSQRWAIFASGLGTFLRKGCGSGLSVARRASSLNLGCSTMTGP